MKASRLTLFTLFCCFIFHCTSAQFPYVQHSVPPGISSTTARMNDLANDASGNKWIAFANFGLGVYDGTNWTVYNTSNSALPSDSTTCIDFDAVGNTWIGSKAGAIYKAGSTFNIYNTSNSGLPSDVITDIYISGTTTWFGTYQGVAVYDGSNWTIYNTSNSGLTNDSITVITSDGNGTFWIGTRNGLSEFNGSTWTSFTTSNSPLNRNINDVACDSFGKTWVSSGIRNAIGYLTTLGVHYIQNGIFGEFSNDIYQFDLPVTYPNISNFMLDGSGNVWFRADIHSRGLVKIVPGGFSFYILPYINFGPLQFGMILEMEPNGTIWTLSRRTFNFYSLDHAGYVQPFELFNYQTHRVVDINDVRVAINNSGDMHWDYMNAKHEIPKGSGKNSVFASAFWIGGFDQGGDLHVAAQTYRQTGYDYWPGPVAGVSAPLDTNTWNVLNRIWKMDKWKIEEFKNQFQAGNVSNGTYSIPEEIASWPAKGNGLVIDNMAPYVDFNANGLYNPMDGDYPLIKGDQMLFYIFNDSIASHTSSGGLKLGVEVHASVYAFSCPNIADSNQAINWTTFYSYDIINRSNNDYDSVLMAIWCDVDLGNPTDDYVGCDTTQATGFVYNGDFTDETMAGYGLNPPMQNVKILRGTLADAGDGIDNDVDGTIDEPGERTSMNSFMTYDNINNIPSGNPSTSWDYYNFMRATWLDNSHVTYGGSGYNSSTTLTNFMYSGTPYAITGWTEATALTPPYDRRFIVGNGPFSFNAGDTVTLDFAYVFTWDSLNQNGLTTSIARNQADLQRVQGWFDNNTFPSCQVYSVGVDEVFDGLTAISVYPNPASDKLFIRAESSVYYGRNYTILNILGAEVSKGIFKSNNISISHLSPQVYLLQVELNNGTAYTKFVKQ